jgi:hypothetical protein
MFRVPSPELRILDPIRVEFDKPAPTHREQAHPPENDELLLNQVERHEVSLHVETLGYSGSQPQTALATSPDDGDCRVEMPEESRRFDLLL